MSESYYSVTEMILNLSGPKRAKEFVKYQAARSTVSHLMVQRTAKGLSTADIAERMGCSEEKIIGIEEGLDKDLNSDDLANYVKALI